MSGLIRNAGVFRQAAPSGFDFTSLGSCVGWWQIHNNDFLTFNGSDVSQITDRSGAANHLVQGTSANQAPVGNLINGIQALDFDGTNYKYNASSLLTPAAGTLATVLLIDSAGTWWVHGTGATAASNNGFGLLTSTGNPRARICGGGVQVQVDHNTEMSTATGYVVLMAWDADDLIARLNNDEDATTHALGTLGTDDFWFGTTDDRTDLIFSGAIGTSVMYDELLAVGDRNTLVSELAAIYGITL